MAKKRRKMRSTFFLKERKDVIVRPDPARLGLGALVPDTGDKPLPWKELYSIAKAEQDSLIKEKRELQDFATDVSNLLLAAAKMLIDSRHPAAKDDTITIPKWLTEQTKDASLQTGHSPTGERMIRLAQRGQSYVEPG